MQIRIFFDDEQIPLIRLRFHPDYLHALEEMGVIEIRDECISYADLRRVNRLIRLRNLLGVNTAGGAIILNLLEQIEQLEKEIDNLKRR